MQLVQPVKHRFCCRSPFAWRFNRCWFVYFKLCPLRVLFFGQQLLPLNLGIHKLRFDFRAYLEGFLLNVC
jgi:hypothetical protein